MAAFHVYLIGIILSVHELTLLTDAQSWTDWSHWSMWSDCSRSCGTGVRVRTRTCLKRWLVKPRAKCRGSAMIYEKCNHRSCPGRQEDFRAQQCARKNYQPVSGVYRQWIPYYDDKRRCKLTCTAEPYDFTKTFGNVIDGTPCSTNSNDLCVRGRCMKVGCDGFIGSHYGEDMCGVCFGKNRTCFLHKGVYAQRGKGMFRYHRVTVIPKGARHILITEKGSNFLALSTAADELVFKEKLKSGFPGFQDIAGSMFYYDRSKDNVETIHARGPTTEDLVAMVLLREPNTRIKYEFWLPKGKYENDARFPKYRPRSLDSVTQAHSTSRPTSTPAPKPVTTRLVTNTQVPSTQSAVRTTKSTSSFWPSIQDLIFNQIIQTAVDNEKSAIGDTADDDDVVVRKAFNTWRTKTTRKSAASTTPPKPTWKIIPTLQYTGDELQHGHATVKVIDNHREQTSAGEETISSVGGNKQPTNTVDKNTIYNNNGVNTNYNRPELNVNPKENVQKEKYSTVGATEHGQKYNNKQSTIRTTTSGNTRTASTSSTARWSPQTQFLTRRHHRPTQPPIVWRPIAVVTDRTRSPPFTTRKITPAATQRGNGNGYRPTTSRLGSFPKNPQSGVSSRPQPLLRNNDCRGECPHVTEDYKHFCKADFVIKGKVVHQRQMEGNTRYQVAVEQTFKSMFPLLRDEFIWSMGTSGNCKCPPIKIGHDYVIMANYDDKSRHSRIVIQPTSYVRELSIEAALNFKDLLNQAREHCGKLR